MANQIYKVDLLVYLRDGINERFNCVFDTLHKAKKYFDEVVGRCVESIKDELNEVDPLKTAERNTSTEFVFKDYDNGDFYNWVVVLEIETVNKCNARMLTEDEFNRILKLEGEEIDQTGKIKAVWPGLEGGNNESI